MQINEGEEHNNEQRPTGALYAIRDTVANDLVGGTNAISVHKHDATAVRFFGDVMSNKSPNNYIGQHPHDFELIRIGWIAANGDIIGADTDVVITGKQWTAAQQNVTPVPEN